MRRSEQGESAAGRDSLQILNAMSELLDSAENLAAVINCVQLQFPSFLGVDRISVLIYDAAQGMLVSGRYVGAAGRPEDTFDGQPVGLSISGQCFAQARPLVVNDCTATDLIPEHFAALLNLKACVAVPILLEGLPMGVLRLDDTRQTGRFSEQDVELYQLAAERISLAIRHFQLSEDRTLAEEALRLACTELEQRVAQRTAELEQANEALSRELAERMRAERIAEVFACLGHRLSVADTPREAAAATLQAADELFGWDACYADLVTDDGHVQVLFEADLYDGQRRESESVQVRPMGPLTRQALEQGPFLILRYDPVAAAVAGPGMAFGNTKRRSASCMFVPVRSREKTIGVLSLQSYSPNAYTPKDLEVLGSLAVFCSGGLERTAAAENLRASQAALRQETAYVRLLCDVAMAANLATSIEEALRTTIDLICDATGWPLGHALLPAEGGAEGPVRFRSARIWHLKDPVRYELFRTHSEAMTYCKGISLPGYVLQTGKPEFSLKSTPQPWKPRHAALDAAGFKSGFAFPVLTGSETVAILEFFSEQTEAPSARLLEVVRHVGVQLGRVVERSR